MPKDNKTQPDVVAVLNKQRVVRENDNDRARRLKNYFAKHPDANVQSALLAEFGVDGQLIRSLEDRIAAMEIAQSHITVLACSRYERILELERELADQPPALRDAELAALREQVARLEDTLRDIRSTVALWSAFEGWQTVMAMIDGILHATPAPRISAEALIAEAKHWAKTTPAAILYSTVNELIDHLEHPERWAQQPEAHPAPVCSCRRMNLNDILRWVLDNACTEGLEINPECQIHGSITTQPMENITNAKE